MPTEPPQILGYAPASARSRFDPAVWPRALHLAVLLGCAAMLSVTGIRLSNAPFVSIHAHLLPFVACSIAFHLAWRALRPSGRARRAAMVFIVLSAVAIMCFVTFDVSTFWSHPSQRGDSIGL